MASVGRLRVVKVHHSYGGQHEPTAGFIASGMGTDSTVNVRPPWQFGRKDGEAESCAEPFLGSGAISG
jgi:hypothetical protein